MSSKPNIAASAIVACAAAAVVLAGCASQPKTVSVQQGAPGSTSASPTPTPASASTPPTRPAKPAAERVPDSAVLTVTAQTLPGPAASPPSGRTVVLTKAATIAEIAADINALPTAPHYPIVNCPMQTVGLGLALQFRDSADGTVLAEVRLTSKPTGVCGGEVEVTVGGVSELPLDDSGSPDFYAHIEQLAGLTASSPAGTTASTPAS